MGLGSGSFWLYLSTISLKPCAFGAHCCIRKKALFRYTFRVTYEEMLNLGYLNLCCVLWASNNLSSHPNYHDLNGLCDLNPLIFGSLDLYTSPLICLRPWTPGGTLFPCSDNAQDGSIKSVPGGRLGCWWS